PHLGQQARAVDPPHTAHLLFEQRAEAELVPESAKKNEPRTVRQFARAVAQPERSRIALHVRPGTNMRACAPSGCLRVRGILLGGSPRILRLQTVFRILNSARSCRIRGETTHF